MHSLATYMSGAAAPTPIATTACTTYLSAAALPPLPPGAHGTPRSQCRLLDQSSLQHGLVYRVVRAGTTGKSVGASRERGMLQYKTLSAGVQCKGRVMWTL